MRNIIKKRGQVWVETVIYTLIALALIGLVLTFATPRIAKARDRAVVEQTIASLNEFDKKIGSAIQTTGNVRAIDFTMKRGELFIKSEEDKILFVLQDISAAYSEPGIDVEIGRILARTTEEQKGYTVNLELDYSSIVNITYQSLDKEEKFTQSPTPYKFSLTYTGSKLDIEEISGS